MSKPVEIRSLEELFEVNQRLQQETDSAVEWLRERGIISDENTRDDSSREGH